MKAIEQEILSFPQKEFFSTLDVSDWEAQQLVLDKHKEVGKEGSDSPNQKASPKLNGLNFNCYFLTKFKFKPL